MLADRISCLRRKNDMSQSQLASELNISASTVGMYEQGRRTPSLDMLVTMAKLFRVSLDYLITGAEFSQASSNPPADNLANNCPCNCCYWKSHRQT